MEPIPAGTASLVDNAVDEAAQTLFSAADVPLARVDELLAALQGPAVRAVLEARIEQIVNFGHSLESDLHYPIAFLASEAGSRLTAARDVLMPGGRRDLRLAHRRFAAVGAMCLAILDVLEVELKLDPPAEDA